MNYRSEQPHDEDDTGGPHVSGHNGSFAPYTPPASTPARCPAALRAKLAEQRADMAQRAAERQAREARHAGHIVGDFRPAGMPRGWASR